MDQPPTTTSTFKLQWYIASNARINESTAVARFWFETGD
jgi:hypothetical protein